MGIKKKDYDKIAFSTLFRYENVHKKGKSTFSLGTSIYYNATTTTIPHNLGYPPFVKVWVKFNESSNVYYQESGPSSYALVGTYQITEIRVDNTNLYVTIEGNPQSSGGGIIYYRIYKEPQA